jgi:hypothetical protein
MFKVTILGAFFLILSNFLPNIGGVAASQAPGLNGVPDNTDPYRDLLDVSRNALRKWKDLDQALDGALTGLTTCNPKIAAKINEVSAARAEFDTANIFYLQKWTELIQKKDSLLDTTALSVAESIEDWQGDIQRATERLKEIDKDLQTFREKKWDTAMIDAARATQTVILETAQAGYKQAEKDKSSNGNEEWQVYLKYWKENYSLNLELAKQDARIYNEKYRSTLLNQQRDCLRVTVPKPPEPRSKP